MKRLVLFFTLIVAGQLVSAQGLKYGVKAGVNFANQEVKLGDVKAKGKAITSFHIFGLMDYSVSSSFSLQPGIGLSGKGFKSITPGEEGKMDLMYIEVPVNLVAKFPVSTVGKIFLGGGPYAAFGVSGKAKADNGETDTDVFSDEGYKRGDFGINLLGGLELTKGFTINANYGLGLSNLLKEQDEITIKNKVVSVSVGFLF